MAGDHFLASKVSHGPRADHYKFFGQTYGLANRMRFEHYSFSTGKAGQVTMTSTGFVSF